MSNRLITLDEFVASIRETLHNVCVKNELSKEDEEKILVATCRSIGQTAMEMGGIKSLSADSE